MRTRRGNSLTTIIVAIALVGLLVFLGIINYVGRTARGVVDRVSAEAAQRVQFQSNAERDNIVRRLELTSDPAKTGYILLLNEAGQPIAYYTVIGKVTSSGKRLTRRSEIKYRYENASVVDAPSDEGTFGSSSPYIYFWTVSDRYVQWSGDYLYSDQPIRLNIEPLVIDIAEN